MGGIGATGVSVEMPVNHNAKALFGSAILLSSIWLIKTALTARRRNTQPWKIIHLPTQYPQPRKSLQPYFFGVTLPILAALALTVCAAHTIAAYHKEPWAAYILIPACLTLAATAGYAGRKHAIANGPHPGGPIWWFNNNYYSRPVTTNPFIGGALVATAGLALPVMALRGEAPPVWQSADTVKVWIVETLLSIIGIGIIIAGIIQKRWEHSHPLDAERDDREP